MAVPGEHDAAGFAELVENDVQAVPTQKASAETAEAFALLGSLLTAAPLRRSPFQCFLRVECHRHLFWRWQR